MTEDECLARMVAPGTARPGKYGSDRGHAGVIQVWVTRACDKSCFNCTQGSNWAGRPGMIAVEQYAAALESLRGYPGVVGMFGGNPAVHPEFPELCRVLRESWVPQNRRGIWCNNPMSFENAREMRRTFDPSVSNLNVHLDAKAWHAFRAGWPESRPVGLHENSRHAPVFVAMRDVVKDEATRWELISGCDINRHWSAMVGVFRGQLRAWFCEVAGAQAMLHQDDPGCPDTGLPVVPTEEEIEEARAAMRRAGNAGEPDRHYSPAWWELGMDSFRDQVRQHCHDCGVPLRGRGELAQAGNGVEQVSATHAAACRPKRVGRRVDVVASLEQLGTGRLGSVVRYLQNSHL